jgi:DNA (cytosine-5)-methyltransferase 1
MMTFGSLFAGIGGFDLGFERAGMRCKWQVELDPYCQRVLAKHWPDVRRWDDVRAFPPPCYNCFKRTKDHNIECDGCGCRRQNWYADVICGGFPCQDISAAGKGAGLSGSRSGLWWEFHRIIETLRPQWAVIENVPALRSRGLDQVLRSLAEIGYDTEWHCIPACAFGAPHRRDRIWIVAYASGERRQQDARGPHGHEGQDEGRATLQANQLERNGEGGGEGAVANTRQPLLEGWHSRQRDGRWPAAQQSTGGTKHAWAVEPDVGRVANGIPSRVDRLRCLGNAVVPQVAEWIGRRIVLATIEQVCDRASIARCNKPTI